MNKTLFNIGIKLDDLLTTSHAIKQWLRDNEPVRAYEALGKLDEKIRNIIKFIDDESSEGTGDSQNE